MCVTWTMFEAILTQAMTAKATSLSLLPSPPLSCDLFFNDGDESKDDDSNDNYTDHGSSAYG